MSAPWLWLIPALPLLGSLLCGSLHALTIKRRYEDPNEQGKTSLAHGIACLALLGSFVLSVVGFFMLGGEDHVLESGAWAWIDTGEFTISIAMVLDRLSSVMALVVTGVGFLIHVYAGGYMKGDPGFSKFFCYLNLFVAAMLMLVLSSSLLGLFIGWEGVGLCSYLLIGFWYTQKWPQEASQKAFVVNRIGDACFLIGSFLLIRVFGTLDMSEIAAGVLPALGAHQTELTIASLLLFGGAMGKSAQLPLFVWLPDAMAGPTPVSALIHAATMVTSGIYLVVRLNPLYAFSEGALLFMGVIAVATAFIAGSSALRQRDIKSVLAYSTVSQLGYMFLALSVGAWTAAIFHLVTHAFFKALLFLGAGSVIHGMHEEQDMYKMGGLRKHMPKTYKTFLVGSAALAGLPLTSGFFSKDEILAHTFGHGGAWYVLWGVGIITAALTAYYTWRMVALTFHGEERFDIAKVHPHESPKIMTTPLMVLAVLAAIGGLMGLPPVFHLDHMLHSWLGPVIKAGEDVMVAATGHGPVHLSVATEWVLLAFGSGIALFFAHRGFHDHAQGIDKDEEFADKKPQLAGFLADAWGLNRTFYKWIVQPVTLVAVGIAVFVDQLIIDGMVNGAGRMAQRLGDRARSLTSGQLANYALYMGGGAAVLALLWAWGAAF